MTNNPLQSKYGMADGIENVPGEHTLRRIRAPGCEHPEELRQDIKKATGQGTWSDEVIGYRCGYCYTEVYDGV